jgi:ribose transport system permease protein
MTPEVFIPAKWKDLYEKNAQIIVIYIFLGALACVSVIMDRDFLTARNLNNLLLSAFPIMIVSFGQMVIIMTAGIDLSLGNMLSLVNTICVAAMKPDVPGNYLFGSIAAILTGILCGAFNGLMVTKARLTPVIATIATMSIYGGCALAIRPIPGGKVPSVFAKFLLGKSSSRFPAHIVLLVIIMLAMWIITTYLPVGKKIRAVGGNEEAAYSSGIIIARVKMFVYSLAGLLTSISAIFLTAQMRCADASVGASYSMNSITVAVIGGTLLTGAVGNVFGIVAGTFIIMILNNILNLVGISSFYQYVFQGTILIIALAVSSRRNRK